MKKLVKNSKKGFSLVEVICVIAIICILASVICFNYIQVFRQAIEALENAL
jgi:prepilin-type N-terminal cleavage/methylation domain-containing protein